MLFYLTGHFGFANRGCEAIVRSTVLILREQRPDCRFLVPSVDAALDLRQWPEAPSLGVTFTQAPAASRFQDLWGRAAQRLPIVHTAGWPRYRPSKNVLNDLEQADILLSIGGDNYSLDYELSALHLFHGLAEEALARGIPAVLWGASVGPFTKLPAIERLMVDHMRRMDLATVRETMSLTYLRSLGVKQNVHLVRDTAFTMQPEAIDKASFWPEPAPSGVVGLNLSSLVFSAQEARATPEQILDEAAEAIRGIVHDLGLAVLLVPHVASLSGASDDDDVRINERILARLPDLGEQVRSVPGYLNAPQLKSVIADCRFFVGARTHATIAAWSSCVPTISIGYSMKARGLNQDLFGHGRYVLEAGDVDRVRMLRALELLIAEEREVRDYLADHMPGWQAGASRGAHCLAALGLMKASHSQPEASLVAGL